LTETEDVTQIMRIIPADTSRYSKLTASNIEQYASIRQGAAKSKTKRTIIQKNAETTIC
jgi:hypothetical protein